MCWIWQICCILFSSFSASSSWS